MTFDRMVGMELPEPKKLPDDHPSVVRGREVFGRLHVSVRLRKVAQELLDIQAEQHRYISPKALAKMSADILALAYHVETPSDGGSEHE